MKKIITVPNGQKLSSVVRQLPSGIIDKKATGIGATYTELTSTRNSIIVVPTKALASSKAKKHGALYVGSPTADHPNKVTIEDISNYHYNNQGHNKIVVVADSLGKVIQAIGKKVYEDYFILIDEIDSFQSESSYRPRLEAAVDHFFDFNEGCVVSATIRKFSDPRFNNLPITEVDYVKPENFMIRVMSYNNAEEIAAQIAMNSANSPTRTIIAFNSVTGIMKAIASLPEDIRGECKVLCSRSSLDKTEFNGVKYDGEIINGILPGRVNFMTSAYFVGVDVDEDAKIFVINDGRRPGGLMSLEKIQQIAGRVRTSRVTPNVIIPDHSIHRKDRSMNELIVRAESQKDIAIRYLQFSKRSDLIKSREAAIKSLSDLDLIRLNKNNDFDISYLNIDAELISQEVIKDLYNCDTSLEIAVDQRGWTYQEFSIPVEITTEFQKKLKQQYLDEYETRREATVRYMLENIRSGSVRKMDLSKMNSTEQFIYECWQELSQNFSRPQDIVSILEEYMLKNPRNTAMKNFMDGFRYQILSATSPLKTAIEREFEVGKIYNKQQIYYKITKIAEELAVGEIDLSTVDTETKAVHYMLKVRKGVKRQRTKNGKRIVVGYEILGDNPYNITVYDSTEIEEEEDADFFDEESDDISLYE